jgi:hypothetical protein
MCDETSAVSRLRYVDAHHVQGGGACLDRLDVREEAGQRIGRLDGLIVDVEAQRVRYFVVQSGTWLAPQWQVLPFFSARLDRNNRALRVDFDRALAAPFSTLDRDALPKFADNGFERQHEELVGVERESDRHPRQISQPRADCHTNGASRCAA